MKTFLTFLVSFFTLSTSFSIAQDIPYGTSFDSIVVHYTYDDVKYYMYYYKPLNYDSLNSPIIFGIHGQGGNGAGVINNLKSIADRRKALIVAPNMPSGWEYVSINSIHYDSVPICNNHYWLIDYMNQIYNHVLLKENRNSFQSYLIGFSAGGQFVTRYMLIRQGFPDSIPIRMAVSSNPFSYTFCTDSLKGELMKYECGIAFNYSINAIGNCFPVSDGISDTFQLGITCNEHVIQYYNENYAVLIGTADTSGATSSTPCIQAQGNNRYERTQNFYHFSDSDAVARGTTLKWQYGEVPGVGHDENLMYNTILSGDSMPLAERLLFETPFHNVPSLAPYAAFSADTTVVTLPSATVQFYNNSINASDFLWDFGDSTNSTLFEPSHTYTYADTFTVTFTASSGTGCENKFIKQNYIIVNLPDGIESYNLNNSINVFPNPSDNECKIDFLFSESEKYFSVQVLNYLGQEVNLPINITADANKKVIVKLNTQNLIPGIYFLKITVNNTVAAGKFIVQH